MTLWGIGLLTLIPLAGLLAAELRGRRSWIVVAKPVASVLFLVAGALFLPLPEKPALLLFVGLVLSFVGDVLLIPRGTKIAFLLGLGSFLAAHVAYGFAFVVHGVDTRWVAIAAAALALGGAPLAQWLFPKVDAAMRGPVVGYVVAITAMVALSAGAAGDGAKATLLAGAALFYASDLTVARERFVEKSMWNGIVGLPLYYAAQLLLIDGLAH